MPRSAKCRRVCQMPTHCRFSPERPAHREAVELTVEEYEALRLMDYLGLNQEEAAAQMRVARTTVQRIYAQARRKLRSFWWRAVHCRLAAVATPSVPRKVAGASAGPAAVCLPRRKGSVLMKSQLPMKTARCSSTLATRHSSSSMMWRTAP